MIDPVIPVVIGVVLFGAAAIFFSLWQSEVGSHKSDKEYNQRREENDRQWRERIEKSCDEYRQKYFEARSEAAHYRGLLSGIVKFIQQNGVKE